MLTPRSLFAKLKRGEFTKALLMFGLYFLVITTIGIMRPIRNSFALDGLADSEFYKVYLMSAVVILFVVPYNRLADRIPWRLLIPGIAFLFGFILLAFRALYSEGSTAFGVVFYGWYDLYAAVMVTQFFMMTQLIFTTRDAKRIYPFAIAGGSIGAMFGSAITGFFAEAVGTVNLLFVAAAFVFAFALSLLIVLKAQAQEESRAEVRSREKLTAGEFMTIFRNKHVLLIASAVLITVLVKQFVDYQFNEVVGGTYETLDAISSFQGKFFAIVNPLPILVLLTLRPLLHRWGVGLVVLMLPAVLLAANLAVALTWSLVAVVVAKAGDASFRYSAERAGREILYVPLPDNIKLKAKAYIDIAVEKGLGKGLSAPLIFVAILLIDYRQVGYVAVGLAVVWVAVALAVKREYVRTLARSIQGRFASFQGIFASLADASTIPVFRQTLNSGEERNIAFALDLVDQADPVSARPLVGDIHALLAHPSPRIRERALAALTAFPEYTDWPRVRRLAEDPDEGVRLAAVRAMCRAGADPEREMKSLLDSDQRVVRLAALTCMGEEGVEVKREAVVTAGYLELLMTGAQQDGAEARIELALALLALGDDPRVPDALGPLLRDPDPRVADAALRTAGRLGRREFVPRLISALGPSRTREAAREALVWQGSRVEGVLSDALEDPSTEPVVRRNIPAVLAQIPAQSAVDDLLRFLASGPTDRLLYHRTLKALNNLRARDSDLTFAEQPVMQALEREITSSAHYADAELTLARLNLKGPAAKLLQCSLSDAWFAGRERVFRMLGLLYEPESVYRSYLSIQGGSSRARANALEWLERTVGHALFVRLAPAIQEGQVKRRGERELREVLTELMGSGNTWLASCATWTALELRDPWVREELELARTSANTELGRIAQQALERLDADEKRTQPESGEMNLIEKVFLLQQVDLLSEASAEQLALLASIAEEIDVEPKTVLIRQEEPTEALYVVIRGAVELRGAGDQVLTAQDGAAFGSWALIDESPSLIEATAVEPSELLRITREDFYDLLADHAELARGLLTGLARRLRSLVA